MRNRTPLQSTKGLEMNFLGSETARHRNQQLKFEQLRGGLLFLVRHRQIEGNDIHFIA